MGFLRGLLILGETVIPHFQLFWLFFFGLGWMVYGFHNLSGIHNASTVPWFLEVWWFRGFLRGLVILEKLWFSCDSLLSIVLTFFFFARDGWFMDFMNLGDSTAIPRGIVFRDLVV